MLRKNRPQNPLTFHTNAGPGVKCCEMPKAKKGAQNAKKVTQNTPLNTFRFLLLFSRTSRLVYNWSNHVHCLSIFIRSQISKFQHHMIMFNHFTACCVSSDTTSMSRILLCFNIQLWQLCSGNNVCPCIFDHKSIWTARTDKKLNVNKPDVTCTKNNTSQILIKKYRKILIFL